MVFSNVVLRFGFNKRINISEEVSRYFFVWLTVIGTVVTFRGHAHDDELAYRKYACMT
jgi:TRAP-type C4-dicarboxylate transport system permease small subunit